MSDVLIAIVGLSSHIHMKVCTPSYHSVSDLSL